MRADSQAALKRIIFSNKINELLDVLWEQANKKQEELSSQEFVDIEQLNQFHQDVNLAFDTLLESHEKFNESKQWDDLTESLIEITQAKFEAVLGESAVSKILDDILKPSAKVDRYKQDEVSSQPPVVDRRSSSKPQLVVEREQVLVQPAEKKPSSKASSATAKQNIVINLEKARIGDRERGAAVAYRRNATIIQGSPDTLESDMFKANMTIQKDTEITIIAHCREGNPYIADGPNDKIYASQLGKLISGRMEDKTVPFTISLVICEGGRPSKDAPSFAESFVKALAKNGVTNATVTARPTSVYHTFDGRVVSLGEEVNEVRHQFMFNPIPGVKTSDFFFYAEEHEKIAFKWEDGSVTARYNRSHIEASEFLFKSPVNVQQPYPGFFHQPEATKIQHNRNAFTALQLAEVYQDMSASDLMDQQDSFSGSDLDLLNELIEVKFQLEEDAQSGIISESEAKDQFLSAAEDLDADLQGSVSSQYRS